MPVLRQPGQDHAMRLERPVHRHQPVPAKPGDQMARHLGPHRLAQVAGQSQPQRMPRQRRQRATIHARRVQIVKRGRGIGDPDRHVRPGKAAADPPQFRGAEPLHHPARHAVHADGDFLLVDAEILGQRLDQPRPPGRGQRADRHVMQTCRRRMALRRARVLLQPVAPQVLCEAPRRGHAIADRQPDKRLPGLVGPGRRRQRGRGRTMRRQSDAGLARNGQVVLCHVHNAGDDLRPPLRIRRAPDPGCPIFMPGLSPELCRTDPVQPDC
mgnify:CR=1 FL=1